MMRAALILAGLCLSILLMPGRYPAHAQSAALTPPSSPIIVSGPWITLGDVANASGPLANVRVAPSPDIGDNMALDPGYVGGVARANGVYFPSDIAHPIIVRRVAGPATTSTDTTPSVMSATIAESAPSRSRQQSKSIAPARARVIDDAPPGEGLILAFTQDVSRGDIISADDLEWIEATASVRAQTGAPKTKSDVIGMEMRRTILAGRAFRISDLKIPALIRKGEPVTLVYAAEGLKLSVGGKALADAAMGEPIRVMNQYSKRAIDAIAIGAGEARVTSR